MAPCKFNGSCGIKSFGGNVRSGVTIPIDESDSDNEEKRKRLNNFVVSTTIIPGETATETRHQPYRDVNLYNYHHLLVISFFYPSYYSYDLIE